MDGLKERVHRHLNTFPRGSLRLYAEQMVDGDLNESEAVRKIETAIEETLSNLIRIHAIVSDDEQSRKALLTGLTAYRKAREGSSHATT